MFIKTKEANNVFYWIYPFSFSKESLAVKVLIKKPLLKRVCIGFSFSLFYLCMFCDKYSNLRQSDHSLGLMMIVIINNYYYIYREEGQGNFVIALECISNLSILNLSMFKF